MKDPKFNLFFAVGAKQFLELILICNVKNILISFAYPAPWQMKGIIKRNNAKVLCDSGAFTAWNLSQKIKQEEINKCKGDEKAIKEVEANGQWKKKLVDIDKYLEFLNKNKDMIYRAVNLDVIPGKQGSVPTQKEILKAAEQGWQNYLYMKKNGWNTIHVFHQGEPLWVLQRMLDECDYIGISPNNDSSEKGKFMWMDEIFRYILNSNNPTIKTHGFAVTSKTLVNRYPWTSVDSSTFSLSAAMGNVLTEIGDFAVSERSVNDKNNIVNCPKEIRDRYDNYLKDLTGYGINNMSGQEVVHKVMCPNCKTKVDVNVTQTYRSRNLANIIYFYDLGERRRKEGPTLEFINQQTLL